VGVDEEGIEGKEGDVCVGKRDEKFWVKGF